MRGRVRTDVDGVARLGTAWAKGASALLAEVPSVVVPEEFNVLINPRHPEVGSL